MKSYKILNKIEFYETIQRWWNDWDFPILGIDSLPTNILVVYHNEDEVCAIPIYLSDANICWTGFITSNKLASKEAREGSLTFGLESLSDFLKSTKYKNIFTVVSNPFIEKSLNESDYHLTKKTAREYIKNI
jgi:hypothetical protein